ncbi:hypothetical protein EV182_003047 [Spiromyces aspiralis]|uniref:Uncharacterized protein n=1 Tax=Spiromyces aspiralis TaxID=68401 RepID=A0ACC1HYH7_9FUNG|nr:hypothetical protein EV182_003047 [Spiromyces aspiralis]
MDLIKVRLQTQVGASGGGSFGVIKSIYANQGILGYYNGLSAAVIRQLTYSMVRFGVYDTLKHQLKAEDGTLPFYTTIGIGMVAGAAGGLAGNPADVINVRMQNDGALEPHLRRNYKHAIDGLVRITREDGMGALFNGFKPNLGRAVLITASQLCSYDLFKQHLVAPYFGETLTTHFLSSVLASLVATTLSSPFDVLKTRVMNSAAGSEVGQGMAGALTSILRNEGPRALFKGWTPAFLRLGPQTIVTFITLERLRSWYYSHYAQKHRVRFE